jgi:hypothetical protein
MTDWEDEEDLPSIVRIQLRMPDDWWQKEETTAASDGEFP